MSTALGALNLGDDAKVPGATVPGTSTNLSGVDSVTTESSLTSDSSLVGNTPDGPSGEGIKVKDFSK